MSVQALPAPAHVFVGDGEPTSTRCAWRSSAWKRKEAAGEASATRHLIDLGPAPPVYLTASNDKITGSASSSSYLTANIVFIPLLSRFFLELVLDNANYLRMSAVVLLLMSANQALANRATGVGAFQLALRPSCS